MASDSAPSTSSVAENRPQVGHENAEIRIESTSAARPCSVAPHTGQGGAT